jgi:alpha,alpha-trehalase
MSGGWTIRYRGVDRSQEPLREALCTLGNGVFATRGAGEEHRADGIYYPGTYLAGGYNRLVSRIVERDVVNEDLVNFPNWTPLAFRIEDGPWFGEEESEYSDYEQTLHLKEGRLTRSFTVSDRQGRRTRVQTTRIVCMHDPHLAGIQFCVQPINWHGRLRVRAQLDGAVDNDGVARYRDLRGDHLVVADAGGKDNTSWLLVHTKQAPLSVSLSARHTVWLDGREMTDRGQTACEGAQTVWRSPDLEVAQGQEVRVEKILS